MSRSSPGLAQVAAGGDGGGNFGLYLDRLVKMIPAEAIGLYLVASGFFETTEGGWLIAVTLIGLAAVIVVRIWGTKDPQNNKGTDWIHVVISSIAFLIWVYKMGGPFEAYNLQNEKLASLLVLAWTFFVPYFYKGPS
jgi:hypothetical protein